MIAFKNEIMKNDLIFDYFHFLYFSASFSWQKTALENLSSHKSHFTFGKGRTLWLRNINEI